ncbi:hypothetical protein NQ317_019093 [Molorchus minor]|uniref:Endonuclease/exonuclease/phosphatase domain-containing protein n=1 Tax=Molorchus minor TaxID=1323400 RepID=A0ABQ9JL86_9CUCU|nr:hypothetical protein NQ317_019093 [Molorchus minor]
MKVLQINLNRAREAHDVLSENVRELGVSMVIASEPNERLASQNGWMLDEEKCAGIWVTDNGIKVDSWNKGKGVETNGCHVYSCYCSPNVSVEEWEDMWDDMSRDMRGRRDVLVAGDMNAKAYEWGSSVENERGRMMMEWAQSRNFVVQNEGDRPTFRRRGCESYLDVTMTSASLARRVREWKVLERESLSDHSYLYFEIQLGRGAVTRPKGPLKWESMDKSSIRREISRRRPELAETEATAEESERVWKEILEANRTRQERSGRAGQRQVYWWNDDVQRLRDECQAARRRSSRRRPRVTDTDDVEDEYMDARRRLKREIRRAKRKMWDSLCAEVDQDTWGMGYKIVSRTFKDCFPKINLSDGVKERVADALFPIRQERRQGVARVSCNLVPPIDKEELERVKGLIKLKRAPGPDGIPPELVKMVVEEDPDFMLRLLNGALLEGKFPEKWKKARLVLLNKGKNLPLEDPRAHRPLSLLNCPGKLYELVVRERLLAEIEENGGFSDRQHGFRKGRGTIGAVKAIGNTLDRERPVWAILITLDVKNAFNMASWEEILNEGARRGISELELAAEKSELAVLRGGRKREKLEVFVRGERVTPAKTVNYLGITLDDQGTFGPHIRKAAEKASRRAAALMRLMPRVGGPSSSKRLLLYNVVASTMLYGAEVWHSSLRIKAYKALMDKTQRKALLGVAGAYRTTSTEALQVITGIPPLDLVAGERGRLHGRRDVNKRLAKKEEREETIRKWQSRWDEGTKGRWTKFLIPDVQEWLDCGHRRVEYYLTQFLTGHGSFGEYLRRIKKTEEERCRYCGAEQDSPNHTIMDCPRFSTLREGVWEELGIENGRDLIRKMLGKKENWEKLHKVINEIMTTKEREEREEGRENTSGGVGGGACEDAG